MKYLKWVFLFFIAVVFSVSLMVLQLNTALKSTLLSPGFFGKLAEDPQVYNAVLDSLKLPDRSSVYAETPWEEDEMPPLKAILLDSMDRDWWEGQAPLMLKGVHAYVTGTSKELPVLDFKPVKRKLEVNAMKEFDRVSEKYGPEKIQRERANLEGRLKLDNIKDQLDMNRLIEQLYQKFTNPLHAVRELVTKYNSVVFLSLILANIFLLIIILLTCFNLRQALGWLSPSFILAGLLGVFIGIQGKNGFIIDKIHNLAGVGTGVSQPAMETIQGGFSKIMLMQSVLLLAAGIVCIILWGIASKKGKAASETKEGRHLLEKQESKQGKALTSPYKIAVRAAVVVLLLAAIPVMLGFSLKSMGVSYHKVAESLSDPAAELEKLDLSEAMAVTTGVEFLNEQFDPSNAVDDRTEGVLMSVFFEVLDSSGKPVGGVVLSINKDRPDGPKDPGYFVTGRDGRTRFSLRAGKYYVKPSQYGFPPALKMPQKPLEIEVKKDTQNDFKMTLDRK